MMHVDPKDWPIETADAVLYKAWMKRKELRLQRCQLDTEVKALDDFIKTYLGLCGAAVPQYKLVTQEGASVSAGPDNG